MITTKFIDSPVREIRTSPEVGKFIGIALDTTGPSYVKKAADPPLAVTPA